MGDHLKTSALPAPAAALSLLSGCSALMTIPQNRAVDAAQFPEQIPIEARIGPNAPEFTFGICRDEYTALRNIPRGAGSQDNYQLFAPAHPITDRLAEVICTTPSSAFASPRASGLSDYDKIIQFVQTNLKYQSDPGWGYLKHPVETIVEGGGDCEDLTNLAAALLQARGRTVAIIREPQHICLGVELRPGDPLPLQPKITDGGIHRFASQVSTLDPVQREAAVSLAKRNPWMIADDAKLPFMFERNGIRFFAVECTATRLFYVKESLASRHSIHVLPPR